MATSLAAGTLSRVRSHADGGSSPSPVLSLADRLNNRDNALNDIRLVLAVFVILSHSFPLGGFEGQTPWMETALAPLGHLAVRCFFAISGYLIVASRMHTTSRSYMWRRFLRIFPGYWVMLLVTAFVLAPLAALLEDGARYSAREGWGYVVENASLYGLQWGIPGTLVNVPYGDPGVWNGSIWTLFHEFVAYLVVLVVFSIPWVRRHGRLVTTAALPTMVLLLPLMRGPLDVTTNLYLNLIELGGFFLAGCCVYFWRDRIPCSPLLAVSCVAAVLVVVYLVPDGWAVLQLPLALSVMLLGVLLPTRLASRHDLSYGLYIYGCPMQQIAVLLGATSLGLVGYILVSLVLATGCAAASWFLIERPALRLKRLVPSR